MNRVILALTALVTVETTAIGIGFIQANQRIERLEARVLGGCAPPVAKPLAGACSDLNTASRLGIGVYVEGISSSVDDVSSKVDDISEKVDSMSNTVDDIGSKLDI